MSEINRGPDTTMGALPHILGLLFGFVGPLLVYVFSNEEYTKQNAAEALNWSVSFFLYSILAFFSLFFFIGIPIILVLGALNVIFPIIAAIKASDGEIWSYPLSIDFMNISKSQQTQNNQRRNNPSQSRQRSNQTEEEQYGGVEYESIQQDEEKTQEERISKLKNRYMRGEISEDRFNRLLDEELSEDEDKDFSQQYN